MCDYSLENVASRAASKGEKLVSTRFPNAMTKGFAGVNDRTVAVCLRPGTELAFDHPVEFEKNCIETRRTKVKVATFRQVDLENRHTHHDALEFSDGQIVRLASLIPGQVAVVLQLPHEAAGRTRHAGCAEQGDRGYLAVRLIGARYRRRASCVNGMERGQGCLAAEASDAVGIG